jgi:hypothetical protein
MRTGSNAYMYIGGGGENRTGSLIELKSGSQSSLCHLLVLQVSFGGPCGSEWGRNSR